MSGTALLRQIFGGKRRRHSSANKREQQEENRQRDALGHIRRGPAQRQHMKQDIGAGIQADQHADGRPVPDSRCRNLAPHERGQGTRKEASMTAAITGVGPGRATTSRPASHKTHNDTKRVPLAGARPVQLGIAVRIKPAIAAGSTRTASRGHATRAEHTESCCRSRRSRSRSRPARQRRRTARRREERSETIGEKRRAVVRRQGRFILRTGWLRLADSYFDRCSRTRTHSQRRSKSCQRGAGRGWFVPAQAR